MIIYNKRLQKIILIDINNDREIIEKSRKGKEFKMDRNVLIFEGEFSNGKRKGKGFRDSSYFHPCDLTAFTSSILSGEIQIYSSNPLSLISTAHVWHKDKAVQKCSIRMEKEAEKEKNIILIAN